MSTILGVNAVFHDPAAALVVDGTQSVGAMPFDVGAVQPLISFISNSGILCIALTAPRSHATPESLVRQGRRRWQHARPLTASDGDGGRISTFSLCFERHVQNSCGLPHPMLRRFLR